MSTTDVRQSGAEDPPQQEADGTQTTTSATGEEHETGGGQSEMGPGPDRKLNVNCPPANPAGL